MDYFHSHSSNYCPFNPLMPIFPIPSRQISPPLSPRPHSVSRLFPCRTPSHVSGVHCRSNEFFIFHSSFFILHFFFPFHSKPCRFFHPPQKNRIFFKKNPKNILPVRKKVVTLHSLSEKSGGGIKKSIFERLEQRRERQGSAPCIL